MLHTHTHTLPFRKPKTICIFLLAICTCVMCFNVFQLLSHQTHSRKLCVFFGCNSNFWLHAFVHKYCTLSLHYVCVCVYVFAFNSRGFPIALIFNLVALSFCLYEPKIHTLYVLSGKASSYLSFLGCILAGAFFSRLHNMLSLSLSYYLSYSFSPHQTHTKNKI